LLVQHCNPQLLLAIAAVASRQHPIFFFMSASQPL
jgi:hypothetical protein